MIERASFDEKDPFDAIAQMAKSTVAEAFQQALAEARSITPDQSIQVEALISGLLVGACGCAMAMILAEGHGELRAGLQAALPDAFDQARSIAGLPPLGAPS